MTARQRIISAEFRRLENRRARESAAFDAGQGVISGKVIGLTQAGTIVRTEHNGTITVPRRPSSDADGFTPNIGASVQINASGGVARLVTNTKSSPRPTPEQVISQIIVATNAPTAASRGNTTTPFWVELTGSVVGGLPAANLYLWTGTQDNYALVSGPGSSSTFAAAPPPGIDSTNPLNASNTPTIDGIEWIDTTFGNTTRLWKFDTALGAYRPMSTINLVVTPPVSATESLIVGDTLTIGLYQWYWNGSDWEKNFCCDGEPEDPPVFTCPDGSAPFWEPDCVDETPVFTPEQRWTCSCFNG
ncbi:MAG: hypothetical protein AAGA46_00350 [Cyanobacteria bacterium P01_F01_bin.13]